MVEEGGEGSGRDIEFLLLILHDRCQGAWHELQAVDHLDREALLGWNDRERENLLAQLGDSLELAHVFRFGYLTQDVVKVVALRVMEEEQQEPPLVLTLKVACVAHCTEVLTGDVVMIHHLPMTGATPKLVLAQVAKACCPELNLLFLCKREHWPARSHEAPDQLGEGEQAVTEVLHAVDWVPVDACERLVTPILTLVRALHINAEGAGVVLLDSSCPHSGWDVDLR